MYHMLTGQFPFQCTEIEQFKLLYSDVDFGLKITYPSSIKVSEEAKDLISQLLQVSEKKRIELDEVLKHSFLTKNNIPKNLPRTFLDQAPDDGYIANYVPKPKKQPVYRNSAKSLVYSNSVSELPNMKLAPLIIKKP